MTTNQKLIAWVSIVGAGLGASLAAAVNFFPDYTTLLTAAGGLLGAVIAFIVTKNQE